MLFGTFPMALIGRAMMCRIVLLAPCVEVVTVLAKIRAAAILRSPLRVRILFIWTVRTALFVVGMLF